MPFRLLPSLSACLLRAIAVALACLAMAQAAQPAAGRRIALVIGNDAYQKVAKLEKAGNDATAMARELRAAGFEVLLHRDLNYRGMVKAVETLANSVTGGDQVVVFFAGHGVQIKTGSYLLPIDIEANSESEVEKTAYGLNDLTDKLSEGKASFVLVVIDACRDNPLKSRGRSIGQTRGLSAIEPPKGQMVVYSASKGQQALDRLDDSDGNPNGVFTREFVARMKRPGVRVEDLVREVQEAVETLARTVSHEQRPAIYNEARGNFYFFGPSTVRPGAAAGQVASPTRIKGADELEQELWNSIRDSREAVVFEEYLRQYPKGRYVAQARVTLVRIQAEAGRAAVVPAPTVGGEPLVLGAYESAQLIKAQVDQSHARVQEALKQLDGEATQARGAAPSSRDEPAATMGIGLAEVITLLGLAIVGGGGVLSIYFVLRFLGRRKSAPSR